MRQRRLAYMDLTPWPRTLAGHPPLTRCYRVPVPTVPERSAGCRRILKGQKSSARICLPFAYRADPGKKRRRARRIHHIYYRLRVLSGAIPECHVPFIGVVRFLGRASVCAVPPPIGNFLKNRQGPAIKNPIFGQPADGCGIGTGWCYQRPRMTSILPSLKGARTIEVSSHSQCTPVLPQPFCRPISIPTPFIPSQEMKLGFQAGVWAKGRRSLALTKLPGRSRNPIPDFILGIRIWPTANTSMLLGGSKLGAAAPHANAVWALAEYAYSHHHLRRLWLNFLQ